MNEPEPASEWSEDERAAFRRELAGRRERMAQAGRFFALSLGIVVAAGVVFRLPEAWWVPAVGAVALAGLGVRLAGWKCPACGERLASRRPGSACPGCGLPLD